MEDKPNVQGLGHEWYFDLDYLTDSLGYTRFKSNQPAGTQDTNTHAGTHDDSDSECDEQVIVVPSNHFSGPKVHTASATVETKDTWKTADTVPAGSGVPATSIPAGSINQAAGGSAVPSTPSSFVVEPVHADTPLPPGHSLGSSENSTRFSSPSDLANHISSSSEMEGIHHHPTTGIFSESTYDADFGGSPINLIACRPKKNVNFAARMAAIIAERRRKFAAQRFQDKKNKPMTYAQQRDYIRTFVKNQSSTIYTTGWTLKHVRSFSDDQLKDEFDKIRHALANLQSQHLRRSFKRQGADLEQPDTKKFKSTEPQKTSVPAASRPSSAGVTPDVHQSPFVDTPPSTPPHSPKASSHPDVTPDTSFIKVLSDDDSDYSDDDSDPLFWHIFAAWEVIPTGLGDVNALYFTDKTSKYFTHLREILHLIDRQDLSKLFGMVVKHYEVNPLAGNGLILWGDLHVLFESTSGGSSVDVWNDQQEWVIHSWKLFSFSGVHVLEMFSGKILYMFVDTPYPLSVSLMKKMLKHKLEVEVDGVGNDMTHAVQLIQFIKNQLASFHAMEFIVAAGVLKYVVPTGRVKVPAGRYVVPTGKDNVIGDSKGREDSILGSGTYSDVDITTFKLHDLKQEKGS
ncbi:hypothetical protein Tco_0223433 [Tanacetum coccineum]